MILFLYGSDNFRSFQKLKEIVVHYRKNNPAGLNLKYFDLEDEDFLMFRNQIRDLPIFKEKKLFVLKNAFKNSDFKERFLQKKEFFKRCPGIILFYERNDISKRDALFNFLIKNAKCQKFDLLDKPRLKNWIKNKFGEYNKETESGVEDLLSEYLGNNLWQITNEIEKLISFARGRMVKRKDVEVLVSLEIESNIFKTIDSIALKDKKKALSFLYRHIERGDAPYYLLTMINFQFRNLLTVKEAYREEGFRREAQKLKLHPYVLRKTISLSQKFSLDELKRIYERIFETDLWIKSGRTEPLLALDLFLARI